MNETLNEQSLDQALDFYQSGNFEAAHALYARMLAEEPENHELLYMLSLCRQKQGRLDDASDYLQRAIELQPDSSMFQYTMGGLQMRRGQHEPALENYRRATELSPNTAKAWLGLGYAQLTLGKLDTAEESLRTARRAVEDDFATEATICAHLGVLELQRERPQQAQTWLQQAVDLNPDDIYAQTQLGHAFLRGGQSGFAIRCFDNAKRLQGGAYASEPQLNVWHAEALEASGDHSEALEIWRQLLAHGHSNTVIMLRAAQSYLRAGETSKALHLLGRAHHDEPANGDIMRVLGSALMRSGQTRQGISMLQQCPASDREAQRLLLRAYLESHQHAAAHRLGQQLQADGDDEDYLLAAQAAIAHGDSEAAQRCLSQLGQHDQERLPALWLRHLASAQALLHDAASGIDAAQLDAELEQLAADDHIGTELRRACMQLRARLQHKLANHAQVLQLLQQLPRQPAAIIDSLSDQPEAAEATLMPALPAAPETLFDADQIRAWPPHAPGGVRLQPVFVLGWPGSGRRELLQALQLHNDIDCLLERPLQADESPLRYGGALERQRHLSWPREPQALTDLTEAEWLGKRQGYKKRVVQELGRHPDKLLIDGMQLPVQGLLAIQRLFPEASVIMVNADPDALQLSWRWSGFEDVEGMYDMWQMQQRYWLQARQTLQLRSIEIDRHKLFADPQQTISELLHHFGLEWQDDMQRVFATASPLYPPLQEARHYSELFQQP